MSRQGERTKLGSMSIGEPGPAIRDDQGLARACLQGSRSLIHNHNGTAPRHKDEDRAVLGRYFACPARLGTTLPSGAALLTVRVYYSISLPRASLAG